MPDLADPTRDESSARRADLASLRRRCRTLTVLAVAALAVAGYALLERQRDHGQPIRPRMRQLPPGKKPPPSLQKPIGPLAID